MGARAIVQASSKVAGFFLRDLVSLFGLNGEVPPDGWTLLQPVYVWVRRLVTELGSLSMRPPTENIPEAIGGLCRERRCSPRLVNQGSWYLGCH